MTTTRTAYATRVTPVLHADDALATAEWYAKLGFEVEFAHQYEPGFPLFVTLRAGDLRIFISEHRGDASPGSLIYLHVEDVGAVDAVAGLLGVEAEDMPWGMREVHLTDPAGNRLRIGTGI